ncbi:hypothetical protein N4R57_17365 [Rhodobacteraceae bacterium D3-12]|nr:hypothetical protein N4R57_17365 [Rhodobacteraceae bacterium D3-12]
MNERPLKRDGRDDTQATNSNRAESTFDSGYADGGDASERIARQQSTSINAGVIGMGLAMQSGSQEGAQAFSSNSADALLVETPEAQAKEDRTPTEPNDKAALNGVDGLNPDGLMETSVDFDLPGAATASAVDIAATATENAGAETQSELLEVLPAFDSTVTSVEKQVETPKPVSSKPDPQAPQLSATQSAAEDGFPGAEELVNTPSTTQENTAHTYEDGDDGLLGGALDPVLGEEGVVADVVETVTDTVSDVLDPVLGEDGLVDGVLGDDGLLGGALDPVLGEDGVVADVVETVTDTVSDVLAPVLGEDGLVDGVLGDDGLLGGALDPVLGEDGVVTDVVETVTDTVSDVLDPVLGEDGLVDGVLGDDGLLGGALDPVLGEEGVVADVVETVTDTVSVVLDPVLGEDGLVDGVLGDDGLLGGALDPVLGEEGVVADVVETVTDTVSDVLDPVLGEDGLVDGVLGDDGLLGGALDPVLGEEGVVADVVETVTDTVSDVLDPVLGEDGLVDGVLGDDGLLGGALDPVLGEEGVVADVVETVTDTVSDVLDPVLGEDGLVDGVLGDDGLLGGALDPVLGEEGVVADVVETVTDTVSDVLDPVLGEDGLVDGVLGDDGLLGGALDPVLGEDGVVADVVETVTDTVSDVLDPVLGEDGLVDGVLGDDGLLGGILGSLLDPVPDEDSVVDDVVETVTDTVSAPHLSTSDNNSGLGDAIEAFANTFAPVPDDGNLGDGILADGDTPTGILDSVLAEDGVVSGVVEDVASNPFNSLNDQAETEIQDNNVELIASGDTEALTELAGNAETPLENVVEQDLPGDEGDDGFLETLIGGLGVDDLAAGDLPSDSVLELPQSDLLDGLLGQDDVFDIDVTGIDENADDLFAGLGGTEGLSGALVDQGLLNTPVSASDPDADGEIDGLLNDILAGGVDDILGTSNTFNELIANEESDGGEGAALETAGGEELLDGNAVEDALNTLFSHNEDQGSSLLSGLFGSSDDDNVG